MYICAVYDAVVAELRRHAVAEQSTATKVIAANASASSKSQPQASRVLNVETSGGGGRRRGRKKRDNGVSRAAADLNGNLSDSSDDDSAADTARPIRKLRWKKKPTKKKTKHGSGECLAAENSPTPPVERDAVEVNGFVEDVVERVNGCREKDDVTTAEQRPPSFADICMALPEVDDLSCEPDASSGVFDHSECSTVDSSRGHSHSPRPRTSPLPPSTTTSTSLYGQQQCQPGLLADVHGSLPLLSRPFDFERRVVASGDARPGDVRRLPKSMSLQGYQHFLTVDDATSARHRRHRRRVADSTYRPLSERGRHTLSRLDVEYINRSQIFQMISGR